MHGGTWVPCMFLVPWLWGLDPSSFVIVWLRLKCCIASRSQPQHGAAVGASELFLVYRSKGFTRDVVRRL